MAEYKFDYRFVGDPLPSTFGASFDNDTEASRWWEGFNKSRGEAVKQIDIHRREGDEWVAVRQAATT